MHTFIPSTLTGKNQVNHFGTSEFFNRVAKDIADLEASIVAYGFPEMELDGGTIIGNRFVLGIDIEGYNKRQKEIDTHIGPCNLAGINEFQYGERVKIMREGSIQYVNNINPQEKNDIGISESSIELNKSNGEIYLAQGEYVKKYKDGKYLTYDFKTEAWQDCNSQKFMESYNIVINFLRSKVEQLVNEEKERSSRVVTDVKHSLENIGI